MKRTAALVTVVGLYLGTALLAFAAEFGTGAEAETMLQRAIVEMLADEKAAIGKFNSEDGGFRDRDLYVFCFNASDGVTTAHVNTDIIGQDVRTFKDPAGKEFGAEMFGQAQEGKISSVSYSFPRPGTDNPVPKESHYTRVASQICGVGYYKE